MSAVRDQSQNTKFVFANFYHLYLQGKLAAIQPDSLAKGLVLKTNSTPSMPQMADVRVITNPSSEEMTNFAMARDAGRKDMTKNLKGLQDARKRLSFLMQEVDEILKRS